MTFCWKLLAFVLAGTGLIWAQVKSGVHPRPTPADYGTAKQIGSTTYAGSVLSSDQVKHLFAVDISKTYLVLELACYPGHGAPVKLDSEDFLASSGGSSEFVHPVDAFTVASVIQEKNTPKNTSNGGSQVSTVAEVGYESGTDPYTGRRVHGVYTGAGVAMGPADPGVAMPPPPGSTYQDRAALEAQLSKNALPSGTFDSPVAGFIYFPLKAIKKKSSGAYELTYFSDPAGAVKLQLPIKSH